MSIKDDTFEMLDNAPVKSKKSILLLVLMILIITGAIPFYLQQQSLTRVSPVVQANEQQPETPAAAPQPVVHNPIKAVVTFDQVSAVIKPEQIAKLQTFYQSIKDMTGTLQIDGYTDNLGSVKEGAALSTQRSEAVAAYLKSLGLSSKITINLSSYGEKNPVADNSTDPGRQQNRRVELTFTPAP
ncbi:MAG: OmpA family protein [Syntrophomonadaceae bacterium]|nr:OmpA family protein [Syntrophomonadaceae bacterium]